MLTVLTFKWRPPDGYRSAFGPEAVNTLYAMCCRHYRGPMKFVCLTDDDRGIAEGVETYPLWDDFAGLSPPNHRAGYPSCYRRLRMFSREVEGLLGRRFVALDLDVVITGDVTPLWDRAEDFVIYRGQSFGTPYNGSMVLMTTGCRSRVWEEFDPERSPKVAADRGFFGSDQGWIAACLGPHERVFTKQEGVYSFRNDLRVRGTGLPAGARMVIFHGQLDPWHPRVQSQYPWVKRHYR